MENKLSKKVLLEEQKRLDEINASGKYSFNQTIDENGEIHVNCDAETYIKEMGYIPLEEHIRRLNKIADEYTNKNS